MRNIIFLFLVLLGVTCLQAQSIGSRVKFSADDGKVYTGIVNDIRGVKFKIKYDGFDFEAWLNADQFTIVHNQRAAVDAAFPVQQPAGNLEGIFNFGKKQGWVTPVQQAAYDKWVAPLSMPDKNRLLSFVIQAKSASARYFVLVSWFMKDKLELLEKFIKEINQYPEAYQQEKCLMRRGRSVIQQWQNTCSVTAVQTFLGDICPRYAWDLKMTPHFDELAHNPSNENANEQKVLLEKYGAPAAVRGDNNAKNIPINGVLDDFVSPLLGVHFYTQQVTEPLPQVFAKLRSQLDRGIDVPLLVEFVGTGARHFILTMKYRNTGNGYEYLIYDPWDGKSEYISEPKILQGTLSPLLTAFRISVDYYYLAQ